MAQASLESIPAELPPAFAAGDPAHAERTREQGHVALLQRMVAAIAAGRTHELRADLAPEVEFELAAPAEFGWVARARGAEAVLEAIISNFRRVREQQAELLSVVAQGDTLMLTAGETGVIVASGAHYRVLLAQQYTFDEQQRLARFRSVVAHAAG